MEGIYLSQCPAHSESSANVSCCCHYPYTAGGSSAQLSEGDIHKLCEEHRADLGSNPHCIPLDPGQII